MPCAHQHYAEHHRALCTQYPVGNPTPSDRREIDKARIPAIDDRRKSHIAHRPAEFEHIAECG